MIRKIIVAGIALLAIALVIAAFVAGIAFGFSFIFKKIFQSSTTPDPVPASPNDDILSSDPWRDPTPSTSPRWASFGLIREIKEIPALPKAIVQSESVSLGEVPDCWFLEPAETPCAITPTVASVQISAPLLLAPALEQHPQPGKNKKIKKSKKQHKNSHKSQDLTKMSRDDLRQRCRELKISRYSALNKAQMIAAISAAIA